jgi:hypothetical protein
MPLARWRVSLDRNVPMHKDGPPAMTAHDLLTHLARAEQIQREQGLTTTDALRQAWYGAPPAATPPRAQTLDEFLAALVRDGKCRSEAAMDTHETSNLGRTTSVS